MTKAERAKQKELVNAANEKSQNDPNWRYKIVGPPWDLQERRTRKKKIEPQQPEAAPQQPEDAPQAGIPETDEKR